MTKFHFILSDINFVFLKVSFGSAVETFDPNLHTLSGLLSSEPPLSISQPTSVMSVKSEDRVGLEDALEQLVNRPESIEPEKQATASNDFGSCLSLDNIKVEEIKETKSVEVEIKQEIKTEVIGETSSASAIETAPDSAETENDVKPSSSVDSGFGSVTSPPATTPVTKTPTKKGIKYKLRVRNYSI